METIIETVEKEIVSLEWDVKYHKEQGTKATEQIRKLKNELNALKFPEKPTL